MDPRQQEALVKRLVQNPQDQAAITEAHTAGQTDPAGYATLLERVGQGTREPALAAHWLNEAANVWLATFNDLHRAATALMAAVEKDPTADAPASRLAELYRSSGDQRAILALFERRATAIASRPNAFPNGAQIASALFEELGRIAAQPEVGDLEKARDSFVRAIELNPNSQFAIYSVRELHKQREEWVKALPYFGMEQALVQDPARKLALYVDQADVAKRANSVDATLRALRSARQIDPVDAALKQQLATVTLERVRGGAQAPHDDLREASDLFLELAEQYPGEHGFLYSLCALELDASSERACQLVLHYGGPLGRTAEAGPQLAAFAAHNPQSSLAGQAQAAAGGVAPSLSLSASPNVGGSPLRRPQPQSVAMQPDAGDDIDSLLETAAAFAKKSRKTEAIATYQKVLHLDPANEEAVAYLQQQLPAKRKYAELRDVLWTAAEVEDADFDRRIEWLSEAAALCERQLKDFEGAAAAWRHVLDLDSTNDGAREQYRRLLERARRWDDLAALLKEEADSTEDLEVRISIEKNLAKLHNDKRKDPAEAGMAWARIAALTPGDEMPLLEAVKQLERAERFDLAADVIAEHVSAIDDRRAQHELYGKLGRLRAEAGDFVGAADALSDGATKLANADMWASAEEYSVRAESWPQAAAAAIERIEYAKKDDERAELNATAAKYLMAAGEQDEGVARLEQAVELAPSRSEFADELENRLTEAGRVDEVARIFLRRADKIEDVDVRVDLRRRAAILQRDRLDDVEAARASFISVLRDKEDVETLTWLADDAESRADFDNAVRYLWRLGAALEDPEAKRETLLREGQIHAAELDKADIAIERYERILSDVDPKCEEALDRIADLEAGRGNSQASAAALERLLEIAERKEKRLEVARQLADVYEHKLERMDDAMRALNLVHGADPDDLDATERLCQLAENAQRWPLFAELMVELISVEGDEAEVSSMTRRLAEVLHEQLGNGDEALNVLGGVADAGDAECRSKFIGLGDQLGKKDVVARRMVVWFRDVPPSSEREEALHGAFERFLETGEKRDAAEVAKLLAQTRELREDVADAVESIALELKDLDALAAAHGLKAKALSGLELASERVRQAEVIVGAGVAPEEALAHGEQALVGVGNEDAEPLLARLAELVEEPSAKIDVYERQVVRSQDPEQRLSALCRAAEVAAELGDTDRAHGFFELVLGGGIEEGVISRLVAVARAADEKQGGATLRTILAETLAAGGQGVRDGGKTRGLFLRRAAVLAFEELSDEQRALSWLSDALVTFVDDDTLNTLEELAENIDDFSKAEAVIGRALEEVFDGPMVRALLLRRATLREERLGNSKGAAEDLKKLLDLSPGLADVADRLSELYKKLEDFRGLVQLCEDQILRGRDKEKRAQLARQVARLWQNELNDVREAADAWRRVLRMAAGDEEAKEGLAAAKEAMLSARVEASVAHHSVPSGDAPAKSGALRSAPAAVSSSAAASSPSSSNAAASSPASSNAAASSPASSSAAASSPSSSNAAASSPASSSSAASSPASSSAASPKAAPTSDVHADVPSSSSKALVSSGVEQTQTPSPVSPVELAPGSLGSNGGDGDLGEDDNALGSPSTSLSTASHADDDDGSELRFDDSSIVAEAALALGGQQPQATLDELGAEGESVASDLDSQSDILTPAPSPVPPAPPGFTPPPPLAAPATTASMALATEVTPSPAPAEVQLDAVPDALNPTRVDLPPSAPVSDPMASEGVLDVPILEVDEEELRALPPPKPSGPVPPPKRSAPPPPPPRGSRPPPPLGAPPPPPPGGARPALGAPPPPPVAGASPPPVSAAPRTPAGGPPPPPPQRGSRRPPPPPPRGTSKELGKG